MLISFSILLEPTNLSIDTPKAWDSLIIVSPGLRLLIFWILRLSLASNKLSFRDP